MKQAVSKMGNQGNQSKPLPPCNFHYHFCSGGHFKISCNVLKEYIHDDGHIALPGRCFILGTITGKTFKDCLNKWLQQNQDPMPVPTTNSLLLDVFPDPVTTSFRLTSDECIHSLEKELFGRAFACKPETGKEAPSEHEVSKPLSAP